MGSENIMLDLHILTHDQPINACKLNLLNSMLKQQLLIFHFQLTFLRDVLN